MDFLRLHLPGLHQALRGALDSFSTFVSYLIGDAVPTVEREKQAAEELGEVATGKPGNTVEEEAQEALECLRSGQIERVGGPGAIKRCQEKSLVGEQTCGWRTDSSSRTQTDKQDTGARKAAEGGGGQEPNALSEARPETHRDRSSRTQEIWEPGEQEMNRGEPLTVWEQEKEEEGEEVWATDPEMVRGVESQPTWRRELEGKIGIHGQKVTEDSKETEWVAKEGPAEAKEPGVKGADSEEERMNLVRNDQSSGAQEVQGPRAESKDWAASGREKADILGVQETEYWPGTEESIPEATGRVWVLEEACKGDQEEEVDEKREAEERLQAQSLEPERTEEAAEGQTAWRESVGDQETGEGFEDNESQDSAIRVNGVGLEEGMQAEEAPREKGGYWVKEVSLALVKEAEGKLDSAASPEARPEELFMGIRSEETQTRQKVLMVKVTEGQEPELLGGVHTSTKQPEDGQEGQETERAPGLSTEETLRSLEEYPSPMESLGPEVETWRNWRRDVDSRNTQEGYSADAEVREEEAVAGQAVEVQTERGQESQLPEVPGWRAEEGLTSIAMNQELEESQGSETGTSQSLGGSEATENKASEGEAAVPWEIASTYTGGRKLEEETLSLQDSEDAQTSSLAAETIPSVRSAGAGEGPEWETGVTWKRESGTGWHSKGREEAAGGIELEEATENRSEQEAGLEGSAEEGVTGHSVKEIGKIRKEEKAEVGTSVVAEEISGVTSGSQEERTEGFRATVETERLLGEQMLLEDEAGGGQEGEWRDHHLEGEAQKLQDVEDERQQKQQVPTVAVPGLPESAEAMASAPGDAHNDWSEALLPGSRLDVSVPRSRVLLSRSSSQRRSRPSFHRTPAPEQQHNPPSLQPQQLPLQPEEALEASPTRPEGTPVPAKKKPLGHGFGLAHSGMMQELQARLNRPKPQ
uniref:Apolipoprotein B receptor n=1 Tax=Nannospalax galili TaxID=1026970 RepID=A0A8C6QJV5_NANGA